MRLRHRIFCLIITSVLLALLTQAACAPKSTPATGGNPCTNLFPVIQDGKIGFIDATGSVKIKAQYGDYEGGGMWGLWWAGWWEGLGCSEGLIPVSTKGGWGFIDLTGKMVIRPQFDDALPFREGLACVSIGGKAGYIDKTGKYRINPQFWGGYADFFFNGIAVVNIDSDKTRHIDQNGRIIVYPQDYNVKRFSEGMAAVQIGGISGRWGYIDRAGNLVIDIQFNEAGEFHGGIALVRKGEEYDFIDKTGKIVLRIPDTMSVWTSGVPNEWTWVPRFSEGLLAIEVNGKVGYIDESGAIKIAPQYQDAGRYSGGLAPVKIGAQWGYIDKAGKMMISPQFDGALPFTNGLAAVLIGDRLGYIDKTGKYVWNPTN